MLGIIEGLSETKLERDVGVDVGLVGPDHGRFGDVDNVDVV